MKKTYLLLISTLCLSMVAISQPILTVTNFTPVIGESQLYYIADSNSIISNTIGANVTFNYSGLQGYGQTQTQYIADPSTTTYASDFPSATLADTTSGIPTNKNYSRLNATDSLTKIGIVANVPSFGIVVGKYNYDPEITMKFPFNYGDTFYDEYSGLFTVYAAIPVSTDGVGNTTVIADAWGTLLLPMGVSIDSVVRVKTTEYLITDTVILGFPFNTTILPIVINGVNINYYKPSLSKFPLLSIVNGSYTQDNAVVDSNKIFITQYPIPSLSVNELENNFNVSIFPNPSKNNNTTLSFDLENNMPVQVDLLNNLGQNVKSVFNGSLQQGNNNIKVNTSNLSKGLYFINIHIGENTVTKKLLIE